MQLWADFEGVDPSVHARVRCMNLKLSQSEFALHRYFLWANRMRAHFTDCGNPPDEKVARRLWMQRSFAYLATWLSFLYVLTEGWVHLRLADSEVDRLIVSSNRELLRRFRNGTFHFQAAYLDPRFTDMLLDGGDALAWAGELHEAFDEWFVRRVAEAGVRLDVISLHDEPPDGAHDA